MDEITINKINNLYKNGKIEEAEIIKRDFIENFKVDKSDNKFDNSDENIYNQLYTSL